MNYELALKLKKAWYPQNKMDGTIVNSGVFYEDENGTHLDSAYAPTLSELIEACGDRFGSLTKNIKQSVWYCTEVKGKDDYQYELVSGSERSSAEEAVANLWLSLNKK